MTAAEAHAAAEDEGLVLLRAEYSTGFKGVCRGATASAPPRCSTGGGCAQLVEGDFCILGREDE